MRIGLDIGHAHQTGAVGNGLYEHTECAGIATQLYAELEALGHTPIIIDYPNQSNADDLAKTIETINNQDFAFGISLHCDSSDNVRARGSHAIYFPSSGGGFRLASAISNHLCPVMKGRAIRVQPRDNLAILKKTKPVWVLVECGFLSNVNDAKFIKNNHHTIAKLIASGINDYIKQKG